MKTNKRLVKLATIRARYASLSHEQLLRKIDEHVRNVGEYADEWVNGLAEVGENAVDEEAFSEIGGVIGKYYKDIYRWLHAELEPRLSENGGNVADVLWGKAVKYLSNVKSSLRECVRRIHFMQIGSELNMLEEIADAMSVEVDSLLYAVDGLR